MSSTVLVTDYAWPTLDVERRILAGVDAQLVVAGEDEAELIELARGADAILTNWRRVPASAVEGAHRCRTIARYGVGVDNIPVARATELGIPVVNVPDFCREEVADHAMALLLACARRIVAFARSTEAGRWELGIGRDMQRLGAQTLGLIGFGAIARALVPRARAFGMRVVAYTPRLAAGDAGDGVSATGDLERLLADADYVSLHAPATAETRQMIGERELRAMKRSAFLINTARGALVDEGALERALREGWIAGAALDVLAEEPAGEDHPLRGLPNCIVTPHAAFWSEQAILDLQTRAAENVASALRGELPASVVNPEVATRENYRLR